ncbi:MAG: hypothetical protein V5A62_15880 [Haloarculaceae archaeon]
MTRSSHDRVEAALRSLRETYRRFDVHQASIALERPSYETALSGGPVEASVRVENGAGEVLAVEEGNWREPRVRVDHEDGAAIVEAARSALADLTGVACRVTDLREVSMVTIHDETDGTRPPKFALDIRFTGRYEGGEPRGGAAWCDGLETRVVV